MCNDLDGHRSPFLMLVGAELEVLIDDVLADDSDGSGDAGDVGDAGLGGAGRSG